MTTLHNYTKLSVLIIDDLPNFCSALRNMVFSYGVAEVDIVHHGEGALQALTKKRYDLVLSDYNLGEGKNGNDILEEAKHHELLKSGALFMMITAETTSEMVRGALEYQPDDYLTKPFTKEVLKKRLDRMLERKRAFNQVYRAMDKDDLAQALAHCNLVLKENDRYRNFGNRLQTELLIRKKDYSAARELYESILQVRPLAWAKLGLGKTYYLEGVFDKAEQQFRGLLDEDRGYVQAWDWLARAKVKQGDTVAAQDALQEAVAISPMNVRRQTTLGELAVTNEDFERAETAYNRAVKVGKHSVFRAPDNYLKLSELLVNKLTTSEGLVNKRLEAKALGTMDEMRKLYRSDPAVAVQSRLMEQHIHKSQGHEQEAERALAKAYDVFKREGGEEMPADIKEQLIEKLEAEDLGEKAKTIVAAMEHEESGHNAQAIELYDQGDLQGALELLDIAVKEKPRSLSINLNMAQVALHFMVKERASGPMLERAGLALKQVSNLNPEDKRYEHYLGLNKRYNQLLKRGGAQAGPGNRPESSESAVGSG
jgi:DNA-binding response OmpR family regulator